MEDGRRRRRNQYRCHLSYYYGRLLYDNWSWLLDDNRSGLLDDDRGLNDRRLRIHHSFGDRRRGRGRSHDRRPEQKSGEKRKPAVVMVSGLSGKAQAQAYQKRQKSLHISKTSFTNI